MLDGPASESMSAPIFRPNTGHTQEARPGLRPGSERGGDMPNFTDLPPNLLKDHSPQRVNDQPSPEEIQLMEQIMSQSANQKKSVSERPSLDKIDTKILVQEKKGTSGFKEKIKMVSEKVKEIAKKIWYYGSGSFIWDKFS